MGAPPQRMRGLQRDREISSNELYRDLRTPMQRIGDWFSESIGPTVALTCLLLPVAFISTTFFMLVCVPILLWAIGRVESKDQSLPLLLPAEAGITDYKDAKPGRFGYHKSRGEFLVGNERAGKKKYELWLSFSHLLTHTLLIGATGSGKTEALVSKVANYLAAGSGVFYSDAKAAPKLGWQIFTLARYFGRDDDFRALNYIKGNTSVKPDRAARRGNNVNLFAYGSAESITQILVSLMPPGGSENKIFSERAIALISAIMPALVDLRDRANLKINPGVIRKALELEEVEKLKRAKPITPESREAIRAYLTSLSGYRENPVDRQGNPTDQQMDSVAQQHGYAQAYYTRALATLSDTYGDIYMVGRGELNVLDCVYRRRIVVVMIPALELAPDEMKNLGKIVLAAQKNAISTGIPPDIEGRKEDVLDNLPTTAPVPYGIINDEFAFMMTPGYGTVLAQARGLYISVSICGQDVAGMKREDADEAEQIFENTKVKIVMASEGLGATRELINEVAGEGYTSLANSFSVHDDSLSHSYFDSRQANFERRSRVDVQDTRSVVEGEAIIFWRDNIVPLNMFYHGIDENSMIKDFTVHRLLDVDYPTRGPGARYMLKDNPMAQAMKRAVTEGHELGIQTLSEAPNIPETAGAMGEIGFIRALGLWRQWMNKVKSVKGHPKITDITPNNNLVLAEGLLLAALCKQGHPEPERLLEDDDENIVDVPPPTSKPLNRGEEIENLEATIGSLTLDAQPSEISDEIKDFSTAATESVRSLNDTEGALALLGEPRTVEKGREPKEILTPTIASHQERGHTVREALAQSGRQTRKAEQPSESEPTQSVQATGKDNGLSGLAAESDADGAAPDNPYLGHGGWVLDPNLLANRIQRPVHDAELQLAAQSSRGAARIEEALGTNPEDIPRIQQETAIAVARSIRCPSSDSNIPATPRNEVERKLIVRDGSRTIKALREWIKSDA